MSEPNDVLQNPPLELHAQLRHDLGNPLTMIRGVAQLMARLVQRTAALSDAERTHYHRHLAMVEEAVGAIVDVLDQTAPAPAGEPSHTGTEAAQQEGEARLRLALDIAALGTWSWDLTTNRGELDERGATIVGLPAGPLPDVAGAQWAAIHSEDLTLVQEAVAAGIATGEDFDLAYRVTYPDGSVHHVASRARTLVDAHGTPVRLIGTNRDVTAEREAEAMLRASEALLQERIAEATIELRALSRRLLLVQEEERRFLARELHDEIGQMLTGLQFELATARSRGESALAAAEATVQALTEQVRQLSMDLRPAPLDAFGLLPALQWLIERFQTQTDIAVDMRHQGIERRFSPEVEIAAYRVIQEALTNVARHADVDQATISLLCDGTLLIVIRDEGCGFDPAATPAPSGLRGLRERVELLDGAVVIDAALGAGVRITAEFPLDDNATPAMVGDTRSA
jgi:PAS domain S-box-containing protein